MKQVKLSRMATSYAIQCLVGQIQVQKQTLAAATNQKFDHT